MDSLEVNLEYVEGAPHVPSAKPYKCLYPIRCSIHPAQWSPQPPR